MSIPLPSDRSFGFTFVAVFGFVAIWLAWLNQGLSAVAFSVLCATMLLVTLLRPSLLNPLNRAWMKVGLLLHRVVSPLVLAAMYFLVITPFALVMRLAGRDELRRRFDPSAQSYWIERDPPGPAPGSFPRQF